MAKPPASNTEQRMLWSFWLACGLAIAAGIRHGLADAIHPVFMAGLPIIAVAFIATLLIREEPLRRTAHVAAGRARAGDAAE